MALGSTFSRSIHRFITPEFFSILLCSLIVLQVNKKMERWLYNLGPVSSYKLDTEKSVPQKANMQWYLLCRNYISISVWYHWQIRQYYGQVYSWHWLPWAWRFSTLEEHDRRTKNGKKIRWLK